MMKRALAWTTPAVRTQDDSVSLSDIDIIQSAQQWAQNNLDTDVLNALPDVNDPVLIATDQHQLIQDYDVAARRGRLAAGALRTRQRGQFEF